MAAEAIEMLIELRQNIIFSTVAWHLLVMADKLINSLLCTQAFKIIILWKQLISFLYQMTTKNIE